MFLLIGTALYNDLFDLSFLPCGCFQKERPQSSQEEERSSIQDDVGIIRDAATWDGDSDERTSLLQPNTSGQIWEVSNYEVEVVLTVVLCKLHCSEVLCFKKLRIPEYFECNVTPLSKSVQEQLCIKTCVSADYFISAQLPG